ncbi:hypothetical protein [uncultured Kordia sp.]|uniref:hypothetical protein n=1 Tax=uncultured Kordia sp. TaxID=507699 RepID=UPI00260C2D75|nr:hypothetical protein [uncultured Kordia sp.]
MRNQTTSLNKLLLSKMKIATVSEQQMILGGDRKKRGQSKTGDTRQQLFGQFQAQEDEMVFM